MALQNALHGIDLELQVVLGLEQANCEQHRVVSSPESGERRRQLGRHLVRIDGVRMNEPDAFRCDAEAAKDIEQLRIDYDDAIEAAEDKTEPRSALGGAALGR